jgi:hypothetical protein
MTTLYQVTADQYAALLRYGAVGATGLEEDVEFLELRTTIDAANDITRYTLLIRYQAVPQRAAPLPSPGDTYPPGETITLELLRRPTRDDVDTALRGINTIPDLVWLTPDPLGVVGWTILSDYFQTADD